MSCLKISGAQRSGASKSGAQTSGVQTCVGGPDIKSCTASYLTYANLSADSSLFAMNSMWSLECTGTKDDFIHSWSNIHRTCTTFFVNVIKSDS